MAREIHMDLSLAELAGLFVSHDWQYGGTPHVQARDIEAMINGLVRAIQGGRHNYGELGRFVVMRDHEFPDSFEVMLKVGYLTDYPDNLDAVAS